MISTFKTLLDKKINLLQKVVKKTHNNELQNRLNNILMNLYTKIAPIETEYYENNNNELYQDYKRVIMQSCAIDMMDDLCDTCESYDVNPQLVKKYKEIILSFKPEKFEYNICDSCNVEMHPDMNYVYLKCPECGDMQDAGHIIFDESQYYGQPVSIARPKKHDSVGHCAKHLKKIQAKECINIPDEVINILYDKLYAIYGNRISTIKCSQIRAVLKNTWHKKERMSKYNNNVPSIRKLITARNGEIILPPQLSVEEENYILSMYNDIMNKFDEVVVKPEISKWFNKKRSNKFYYPYFIYKILEIFLKGDNRLEDLLECIHLQDDYTLVRNDKVWKYICEELSLRYKPTG